MGITCPKCGSTKSQVTDTRACPAGIRRRRECTECGTRWATREIALKELKALKKVVDTLARD